MKIITRVALIRRWLTHQWVVVALDRRDKATYATYVLITSRSTNAAYLGLFWVGFFHWHLLFRIYTKAHIKHMCCISMNLSTFIVYFVSPDSLPPHTSLPHSQNDDRFDQTSDNLFEAFRGSTREKLRDTECSTSVARANCAIASLLCAIV